MNTLLRLGLIGVSLFTLLSPVPVLAADLVIKKGDTYVVKPGNESMSLDKLVIEDNAKITFADGVTHWEMLAKDAVIGHGVVIDGTGKAGTSGSSGASPSDGARACQSGKSGKGGEPGEPGTTAVDIYLGLDARSIGSLRVEADGGAGGAGGAGGQGQDAGSILNCPASRGGNGGHGGPGGDGGRGGNVVVSIAPLETDKTIGALAANVRVSVKPGKAGKGGEGGDGGAGSEGQYVNQKTLSGSRKWVPGGPGGRFGATGEDGNEGSYGQVFVGGKFSGFPSVSTHTDSFEGFDKYRAAADTEYLEDKKAAEQEIKLLKEQLKALQDRMEKLED